MRGSQALARLSVEVFVEEHEIFPVRVIGIAGILSMAGTLTRPIRKKDRGDSLGKKA